MVEIENANSREEIISVLVEIGYSQQQAEMILWGNSPNIGDVIAGDASPDDIPVFVPIVDLDR